MVDQQKPNDRPNVLITGANGLVGSRVIEAISKQRDRFGKIVALDIRPPADSHSGNDIEYVIGDICDPEMKKLFLDHEISTVVHLAAIVAPGKDSSADMEYRVDILGTENIVKAAAAAGLKQIISLSSGAAYGYHASNPVPLKEDDPLRGNEGFTYSKHKRLVEELLARYRQSEPQLRQLILRPGTILGPHVRSPVSAVFEGPVVIGVVGADTPFVMIHVDDVASIIVKGILECREGIYNLAGDGVLTLRQIAKLAGKPYLPIPVWLLKAALAVLKATRLSVRGPESVDFLRYRPVLDNEQLKSGFGFVPTMTSAEVFDCYLSSMEDGGS